MTARRFLISGRVQGVFFRASTRTQAERLGLAGHAINLSDGRVEVVAHGDEDSLAELALWLQRGPEHARVDQVETESIDESLEVGLPERFVIG